MIKRGYECMFRSIKGAENGGYPPTQNGGCPFTFRAPDSNSDAHRVRCYECAKCNQVEDSHPFGRRLGEGSGSPIIENVKRYNVKMWKHYNGNLWAWLSLSS